MMRKPLTALALSGLLALSGGLLAESAAGASTPAPSAARSQPTVSIATVKGLGKVLVDSKKHALYSLVKSHRPVPCTGTCLDVWTPLTVKAGSKPTAGKGVKGLGVVVVAGANQVTENGFPLYLFTGDKALQAQGAGLTTSGATWHVVKVTGSRSGGTSKKKSSNAGTGGVSF
jgi:predicted lipoprotein with Yx(FWY)xxD motif